MTAFLPQHDSERQQAHREKELQAQRKLYQYDYTHISPLAVLKDLPVHDEFSFQWLEHVGMRAMEGIANRCELESVEHHKEQQREKTQQVAEPVCAR